MQMFRKIFVRLIFISLLIACFFSKAQAIEPKITDIIVTNNTENVLLYARLVNGFKTEMESSILAGVPSVFTLEVEVYRPRTLFWDKSITSHEIKRMIKYDILQKTFSIFTNGNPEPQVFPDFESAQKAMADFSGIAVAPLRELVKGEKYNLRMKIKIDKVSLPLHMEKHILFFVSYWDFETAWYTQKFSY
jgi:Domain of unknown function (DUF4390)